MIRSLFPRWFGRGLALLGLLAALCAPVGPAQADGTITVTNCTGQGLADAMNTLALSGGGLINFDCVPNPAVLTITQAGGFNVTSGVIDTIDGGNRIILDGGGSNRLFDVQANAALTLTNITLTHGSALVGGDVPGMGGAILAEGNSLTLEHVTLRANQSNVAGGALRVVTGTALVQNSLIEQNTAASGGGIDSSGALTLTNTLVRGNSAYGLSGGGLDLGGPTVISNSQILSNTAQGTGTGTYSGGGGINLTASGSLSISGSRFDANHTFTLNTYGGAILSQGALTVTQSTFAGNAATLGGGIFVSSTATLTDVALSGNSAYSGGGLFVNAAFATLTNASLTANHAAGNGGGIYVDQSSVTVEASTFDHNTADAGGGAYSTASVENWNNTRLSANSANIGAGLDNSNTAATLNNVTFSANTASGPGGAIYNEGQAVLTLVGSTLSGNSASQGAGIETIQSTLEVISSTLSGNTASRSGGGLYNFGQTTLTNATLSGNSAQQQGGGAYNVAQLGLLNVTFSHNAGAFGGALYMGIGNTTVLTNTILAYSPAGGNCSGTLTAATYSLSSDNSCGLTGLVHGHDSNSLDPLLTALGNYGGPTLVHMLKLGSPAIAGVVGNAAPVTDQRGQPRPGPDGSFDIGAVERQPTDSDLAPWLWLPLVRR